MSIENTYCHLTVLKSANRNMRLGDKHKKCVMNRWILLQLQRYEQISLWLLSIILLCSFPSMVE